MYNHVLSIIKNFSEYARVISRVNETVITAGCSTQKTGHPVENWSFVITNYINKYILHT